MAREKIAVNGICEYLNQLSGVKVYEQVWMDKWDSYAFNFVGVLASQDERYSETLEDSMALTNLGKIDVFILCGVQVKKSAILGKANLRNALQDICEMVEYKLHNKQIEDYISDYETCEFAPIHFVSSEPLTYAEDESKGCALMTFRIFYTKNN